MKNKLLLFLMSCLALAPLRAETLTIGECVRLARENYPAIAQYGLIEKTTQFSLSNASKAWLPHGSVAGQLTWQNDVAAWPEKFAAMLAQQGISFPGLDKTQYKVGIDLSQQIWDGGQTAANRRAIESASEVERRSLDLQLYDVEGRVEDIYFGVLLLNGRINSLSRSAMLVDSTLTQVKAMFNHGVAMQSDCDQIEAKLLGIRQQMSQLSATCNSYRHVLEIFIGESIGNRELLLPDEEPAPTSERPQLRLFDSQICNLSSQESAVKASVMPQIGAFASGYYGYPGFNMFKNMQNHDPSLNFLVGIKVSWNFGSLYTRGNSLNKLRLQRQIVEANRETYLFNNRIAQTESSAQIASLREVMQNDHKIVQLRRSVVSAARSQLRNGIIDANSLLSKITDAELAENDLVIHNIELTKAIYNLNHIRNK